MTIVDEFRRDESRVLDRLVDGELSQSERRELLAALEDEPGAWRRTALVFLEAQSWRWQLAKMAAEPILAQAAAGATRGTSAGTGGANRRSFWGACLAIAGSLLVAFGLGTRYPTTAGVQPLVADVRDAPAAGQPDSLPATADSAGADNSTDPAGTSEPPAAGNEPAWETLTLALGEDAAGANTPSKIQVRARDADLDDADWLSGSASNVPTALIEQLEQEGWKVTRERRLLPVSLSDGRRMIVPVVQVDIRQGEVETF